MTSPPFSLDAALATETLSVSRLDLCEVRLMDDARFAWLVLIPRIPDLVEITDLSEAQQAILWREVNHASRALRACVPCDKLNLGALGNIVRQLHVHVIARRKQDAAWPGAVWGCGEARSYSDERAQALRKQLRAELTNVEA